MTDKTQFRDPSGRWVECPLWTASLGSYTNEEHGQKNPQAMRQRRETIEHPLPKVATEMALHVLAYKLTRVINIVGTQPLMAAITA